LGAGHGRDALYFARRGFSVQATDFSPQALGELRRTAEHSCLGDRVANTVHDGHYGTGIAHGDGIFEHCGFAVHFFDRALVDALAQDWTTPQIHPFEEGELPRRPWRVTQHRPS
jgi:hypothetical protein